MRFFILIFSALLLLSKPINAQELTINQKSVINIVVSINPLYQVVQAIAKDKANNFLIYNKNYSEHNYQLKSDDVKAVENADLILMIDKNYETNLQKYLEQLANSKKIISLSQINQIKVLKLRKNSQKNDLHLWLNPQNIEIFAEELVENLCQLAIANCQFFRKNLSNFKKENNIAIQEISKQLASLKDKKFIFYRDCFQYFEEYFALKPALIIDDEHSKELKISRYKKFNEIVNSQEISCLFGDANDENNSAQKLAKNYNLKFAKLDIIGLNKYDKKRADKDLNGYSQLLLDLANNIAECSLQK
jgi:ABC-type Zn uptake system ZnuABC Zn-binding protein ZnuA